LEIEFNLQTAAPMPKPRYFTPHPKADKARDIKLKIKPDSKEFSMRTLAIILILTISVSSCDPDPVGPRPYNYIIEGPQDLFPAFSPDGEYIAYFHDAWYPPDPNYPSGLYIIDKDGGNRKLVLSVEYFNSPSWSPDGQWLVFSAGGIIQKCKTTGEDITTFTGLDYLEYPEFYYPDWSSDGNYILFDNPFHPDAGLYSMTSGFENAERIFGRIILGRDPEFSPNGEYFVYYGWVNNTHPSEIFISNISGTIDKRLTNNNRDDRGPTWSPDGQKIAWSSSIRLCIMNSDGSNHHEIGYGNDPSWSVKNEIVFSHANADYSREVLYTINPDGSNKRQITF
jgi:TolB protein